MGLQAVALLSDLSSTRDLKEGVGEGETFLASRTFKKAELSVPKGTRKEKGVHALHCSGEKNDEFKSFHEATPRVKALRKGAWGRLSGCSSLVQISIPSRQA